MEIDQRLLDRSVHCVVCRAVVSEIRAGKDLNQAILDGLLASSQIAIQYELAYQHAVMSSPEPDRTVAPPALEWITGYGWGDHR